MTHRHSPLGALLILSLSLPGCANEWEVLHRVVVSGTITAPQDQGKVTGEINQAWAGEGDLRYPIKPFGTFELEGTGAYELVIDYPVDGGEGLILYAYQDVDGDGELCTLTNREEPAGVAIAEDFSPIEGGDAPYALTLNLDLNANCAGPEALYP